MSHRFARNGWPRGGEAFLGGTITASATPHNKGPWVDLDASVARDICGFYIQTSNGVASATTDTSMLMDIGVGATGDAVDEIKVNNIAFGAWQIEQAVFIPLHVRAGERLAARIQGAVVSDTFIPRIIHCFADRMPGWGGYSAADTYTANTATSAPTTGDLADNAWDEAVASTTNPIKGLTVHPCGTPGDTSWGNTAGIIVDVGVGGAGSEVLIGSVLVSVNSNENIYGIISAPFIEAEIATGSRLALRKNSTEDLSGLVIGWR